jgi:hypothetical protein
MLEVIHKSLEITLGNAQLFTGVLHAFPGGLTLDPVIRVALDLCRRSLRTREVFLGADYPFARCAKQQTQNYGAGKNGLQDLSSFTNGASSYRRIMAKLERTPETRSCGTLQSLILKIKIKRSQRAAAPTGVLRDA